MRPSPRTTARAALLALLALAVLLTAGCSIPTAGAQTGYPYPVASATVPAGATATVPAAATATTPAGPTATTPAGATATAPAATAVAPTAAATVAPARTPTPRPTGTLPNSSEGSFPVLFGVALLALAGAVAVARRRLS